MLAPGKVTEVERLLAEGSHSQRKIARTVGVCRAVVSDIAKGKRPDYAARRLLAAELFESLGPIERCPTCGGRVYAPCRLCRIRQIQAQEQELLRRLRRQARERTIRRLLVAVMRAAAESQRLDRTPSAPLRAPIGRQTSAA